jgi:hypothetical protein
MKPLSKRKIKELQDKITEGMRFDLSLASAISEEVIMELSNNKPFDEILKLFIQKAIGNEREEVSNFILKQAKNRESAEGFYIEWSTGCLEIKEGKLTIKDRLNIQQ